MLLCSLSSLFRITHRRIYWLDPPEARDAPRAVRVEDPEELSHQAPLVLGRLLLLLLLLLPLPPPPPLLPAATDHQGVVERAHQRADDALVLRGDDDAVRRGCDEAEALRGVRAGAARVLRDAASHVRVRDAAEASRARSV